MQNLEIEFSHISAFDSQLAACSIPSRQSPFLRLTSLRLPFATSNDFFFTLYTYDEYKTGGHYDSSTG